MPVAAANASPSPGAAVLGGGGSYPSPGSVVLGGAEGAARAKAAAAAPSAVAPLKPPADIPVIPKENLGQFLTKGVPKTRPPRYSLPAPADNPSIPPRSGLKLPSGRAVGAATFLENFGDYNQRISDANQAASVAKANDAKYGNGYSGRFVDDFNPVDPEFALDPKAIDRMGYRNYGEAASDAASTIFNGVKDAVQNAANSLPKFPNPFAPAPNGSNPGPASPTPGTPYGPDYQPYPPGGSAAPNSQSNRQNKFSDDPPVRHPAMDPRRDAPQPRPDGSWPPESYPGSNNQPSNEPFPNPYPNSTFVRVFSKFKDSSNWGGGNVYRDFQSITATQNPGWANPFSPDSYRTTITVSAAGTTGSFDAGFRTLPFEVRVVPLNDQQQPLPPPSKPVADPGVWPSTPPAPHVPAALNPSTPPVTGPQPTLSPQAVPQSSPQESPKNKPQEQAPPNIPSPLGSPEYQPQGLPAPTGSPNLASPQGNPVFSPNMAPSNPISSPVQSTSLLDAPRTTASNSFKESIQPRPRLDLAPLPQAPPKTPDRCKDPCINRLQDSVDANSSIGNSKLQDLLNLVTEILDALARLGQTDPTPCPQVVEIEVPIASTNPDGSHTIEQITVGCLEGMEETTLRHYEALADLVVWGNRVDRFSERSHNILGGDEWFQAADSVEPVLNKGFLKPFLTNDFHTRKHLLDDEDPAIWGSLPAFLQSLIGAVYGELGLNEFPCEVPSNLFHGSVGNRIITSQLEYWEWYVMQFDGLMGQFPIEIEFEDTDPTQSGDQYKKVELANISEALSEMFGLSFATSTNADVAINFLMRLSSEVIATKNAAIVAQDYARGNASFLGYRGNPKKREVDYSFDPGHLEDLALFLRESKGYVMGWEEDDKESVVGFLQKIVFSAGIIKAAFFRDKRQTDKLANELDSMVRRENSQFDQDWTKFLELINNPNSEFNRGDNADVDYPQPEVDRIIYPPPEPPTQNP